MQKLVSSSHDNALQLDKKVSLVSQCRLPSFRDGFSVWVQNPGHMNPMPSDITLDRVSTWQDNAGFQLPSILTLLERDLY